MSLFPTIIALHGFTGCGRDFDFCKSLEPEWNWMTPDLPGHGGRSAATCSWDSVGSIIDEAMLECTGSQKPFLFGYSMGGRIALHYALENQDKLNGLILVSTTAGIEDPELRRRRIVSDEVLADRIGEIGIQAFQTEWLENPVIQSQKNIPEPWRTRLYRKRQNTEKGLAASLCGLGTGTMPCLWGELKKLDLPVLLVSGECDRKFSSIGARMNSLIRGAVHKKKPNAGHTVHLEEAAAVLVEVKRFVSAD